MPEAVGVDVGGTKILSGLVAADGSVLRTDLRSTPPDPEDLVEAIIAAVVALGGREGGGQLPVGCGFPALVTRDGVTRYGPNITLREHPLRDTMQDRLGTPHVVVENDASAATWAEFAVGAGRDVRDSMVMYTLGTGVGGGLILDRRLHRGANGFAGELGHAVIIVGGEPGPSGVDGELEAYSSGTAMARMARQAHADGRFAGTPLEGEEPPTGQALTAAARQGVEPAVEVLATAGRYLGIAAAGLVNALDPEMIVVGGGAADAGDLILDPARRALAAHLLGAEHRPEVPLVPALLGPDAGMVGVALLALEAARG
jgi:glucokinase